MEKIKRRKHTAGFKAKVALESTRGQKTIPELARQFSVHPSQVQKWKKILLERLPELFAEEHNGTDQEREKLMAALYQQIGQLQVELDWFKKKSECLY